MKPQPELPAGILVPADLDALRREHPDQLHRIRVKLARLDALDRHRQVFASYAHDYKLEPRLAETAVAAWESAAGLRLPDLYRRFVLELGDGGAGPAFGVSRLGGAPPEWQRKKLQQPNLLPIAVPPPGWWEWELAQKFQPPGDDGEDPNSPLNGTIDIGGYGCMITAHLVVNGPHLGVVWVNNTGSSLSPAGMFGDWYEEWLDTALQGMHWSTRTDAAYRRKQFVRLAKR